MHKQWGFTGVISGVNTLTFPIAFTSAPFALLSEANAAFTSAIDYTDFSKNTYTSTKADIVGYNLNISNYGATEGWWIAIGI